MGKERKNYKIGLYLEKALDDKKITTKELADLTGIEVSLLRRYYINEKSPSLTNIEKIAKALDKDVEYFTNDFYFENGNMRASILSYDLLLHIDENSDKDNRKAFKSMVKMLNQVFNSLTDEGRKILVKKLFIFLSTEVYTTAYDEKNPDKTFWSSLISDDSLLKKSFTLNEKDIAKFQIALDNLFNSNVNDEEKEDFLNSTLDKINTTNQLEEQKKDDNWLNQLSSLFYLIFTILYSSLFSASTLYGVRSFILNNKTLLISSSVYSGLSKYMSE